MAEDLPQLEVPAPECPAVLLPTPANLSNMFGDIATLIEKMALSEIDSVKSEAENLKEVLDGVRKLLSAYDPKWKKLSIPEKEWEIIIQRLIEEYPMYIQTQIMSLISSFVSFNVPLLGIQIDVLKLATDRAYLDELSSEIAGYGADVEAQIAALADDLSPEARLEAIEKLRGDKLDALYDLLPSEYKIFSGEYGLENGELKAKQIMDFLKNEATKFMNGQLFSGFGGLIGAFDEIWDALGLPGLPVPLTLDVKALIDAAIADAKTDAEKLANLKNIKIAGFDVMGLLGGEFTDNVESMEFTVARITAKLKEFKENWQLFLLKDWMGKVTSFFDAIGLGALTKFVTLDFCTFMGLMGIPNPIIDLSSFSNISAVTKESTTIESVILADMAESAA